MRLLESGPRQLRIREVSLISLAHYNRLHQESDYTDSSGVDLLKFITNTLHKNQRDRDFLFDVESTMISFVADNKRYDFSNFNFGSK